MNKKYIAAILSGTMLLGVSGCGNGKKASSDDEIPTVTWNLPANMSTTDENIWHEIEEKASEITREKVGANLKLNLIDNSVYDEKMRLALTGGEEVDLVFTSSWMNKLDENVERGSYLPLNDLIDQYGSAIKAKLDERAWLPATYNGEIMAVPSQAAYVTIRSFVFKKDLVEKYNFDYKSVKSIEDLEPYFKILKENEPDIIPLLASPSAGTPGGENTSLTNLAGGVCWNEKEHKLTTKYEDPDYLRYNKTLHDYYVKGYVAADAAIKTDFTSEAKSGKYAVMQNSGMYTEDGSKSSNAYGFPCVESPIPTGKIFTNTFIGITTGIGHTCKHPEKAMQVLNLVWEDPALSNLLAYGLEGKNYEIVDDSNKEMPEIHVFDGDKQTWCIYHNYIGPLFDQWGSEWNSRDALDTMQENNKNGELSDLYGFRLDRKPIKTQLVQIESIVSEVTSIINTGSMNDFDQYIADTNARLKAAGIDSVKEEIQRQIDEWKNSEKQ